VLALANDHRFAIAAPDGLSDVQVNQGQVWRKERSWAVPGATTGVGADGKPTCNPQRTTDLTFDSCVGVAQNACSWVHCMADDVAFVAQLVAELQASLCVEKVFAYGGSNGGLLIWELGSNAETAPLFTALASVAGLPMRGVAFGKAVAGALPLLLVTSLADTRVPPGAWGQLSPSQTPASSGLVNFFTSASAAVLAWGSTQGCSLAASTPVAVPGTSAAMACKTPCPSSAAALPNVVDCRLSKGGHDVIYGDIATTVAMAFDFFTSRS